MICEIQQDSNTTFRVYDYDRIDKDGNKRPLYIEQVIAVAETKPAKNYKRNGSILAKCKYFTVEEFDVNGTEKIELTDDSFKSVIVVDGKCEISKDDYKINVTKGDSIFIPAQNTNFKIKDKGRLILTSL